ncbi:MULTISPECIES: hypothetical protein [unclassified Streptomyces]|uniref:hypothetical protein n=1 Tax=unclassified Streptomyces TaxID=2593676 RepID=UPI0036676DC0
MATRHLDGMNYVFTMPLSDHAEHDGGDYIYYQGHPWDFEAHHDEITAQGHAHPDVGSAPFQHVGDTMFTRGSRAYGPSLEVEGPLNHEVAVGPDLWLRAVTPAVANHNPPTLRFTLHSRAPDDHSAFLDSRASPGRDCGLGRRRLAGTAAFSSPVAADEENPPGTVGRAPGTAGAECCAGGAGEDCDVRCLRGAGLTDLLHDPYTAHRGVVAKDEQHAVRAGGCCQGGRRTAGRLQSWLLCEAQVTQASAPYPVLVQARSR